MPRIARGLSDGLIYHVINRGNGKQQVFHKEGDYRAFLDLMQEGKESYGLKLLAYCLMPNHFHLLVRPEKGEELSRWMQWLMTSHVRRTIDTTARVGMCGKGDIRALSFKKTNI